MRNNNQIRRRDLLKALATVPFLGAFAYGVSKKKNLIDALAKEKPIRYLDPFGYDMNEPKVPILLDWKDERIIKIGLIGFGIRGKQLAKAAGFEHPDRIEKLRKAHEKNGSDYRYQDFMEQVDLNIEIAGVCDVFDVYATDAFETANNIQKLSTRDLPGGKITSGKCTRYKNYRELLASPEIEAVIIAVPDHWHATIAVDAAKAGKHVYSEKPFTRTIEEAFEAHQIIKESGVVFQLGHQNRQIESYNKAKELIAAGILGKVNLVETFTNRNSNDGAWLLDLEPLANEKTVDWKEFLGKAPYRPFSAEIFRRWKLWWDFGTGMSGNLFTHEWDCMNQIFNLGIPYSAMASGGIYYYKDGREIPDTYQCVYQYPEKDLTLSYTATLSNSRSSNKQLYGSDGFMSLGNTISVYPDRGSKKYAQLLQNNQLNPDKPMYSYPESEEPVIDGVSSASALYYISRGLVNTQRNGKRVDTTHLHIKEWLQCIRENKTPSCPIDLAFDEAITAHMGTLSYREKQAIFWDKEKKKVTKG